MDQQPTVNEGFVPATDVNFDEAGYLAANPDVEQAVKSGFFPSGRRHFELHGRSEDRMLAVLPQASRSDGLLARFRRSAAADDQATRRFERLEARIYDLEVSVTQLSDMLTMGEQIAPPPPKHLQKRVVGSYNGNFVRSGFTSVHPQLVRVLASAGQQLDDCERILDFGCGSGRAIYALSRLLPNAELFGTDIDPEAIAWLQQNWHGLADYSVCPPSPPLPYDDDTFDFVFGISVFTHLPEDLQTAWLADLQRVTKPGGYVLLTTHGEHASHGQLSDEQAEELKRHGFLYTTSGYGAQIGLPDFYETAFHTHDYVQRVWSDHFEVVAMSAPAPGEHQDSILLRKRR